MKSHPQHLRDQRFEGFRLESFRTLERLRASPTVAQLQADRQSIRQHVQEPFALYRDELVVHWALPRQLPFETERGVFSRLPKNDFGAGGAHHHLWMAFYRPPRRRLTDIQLSHGIHPEGFAFGLYVGAYAGDAFGAARQRLVRDPGEGLRLLNELIGRGYTFSYSTRVSRRANDPVHTTALSTLPDELANASGIWVRRMLPREEVLRLGPDLVLAGIDAMDELWPLYSWLDAAPAANTS